MQKKYDIRKATEQDIDLIMKMFDHSRTVMRQDGNHAQWVGYPTRADVAEDVRRGVAYLVVSGQLPVVSGQLPVVSGAAPLKTSDNAPTTDHRALATDHWPLATPIGTFALVPGEEPTYGYIDHGRWIDERTPYCTLHRVAAMPGTSGVAEAVFRYIKDTCTHLRVDTHALNRPMRHILEKEGFVYCGIIYMPDGGPRDAYEWWRWDEVPDDLKQYVEQEILPRHEDYDAAHRPDHVRRVIARSMCLLSTIHYPLPTLTYAAAAMHDIGICCGREEHHLHSGRIIREDRELRRWFSEDEIELIAQAAEDHRASATRAPRSLLGCIVAEADRDIEPETIMRRTVEYGISHYGLAAQTPLRPSGTSPCEGEEPGKTSSDTSHGFSPLQGEEPGKTSSDTSHGFSPCEGEEPGKTSSDTSRGFSPCEGEEPGKTSSDTSHGFSPLQGEMSEGQRGLDREGHWQRTLEHLHEKYAEGGYIKLWLEESPNAAPLAELRALIADEGRLRAVFEEIFDNITN